tara:strand:+ start:339 stop:653 length:315 start_codon:yes stop_codon:yes gene_type:complete
MISDDVDEFIMNQDDIPEDNKKLISDIIGDVNSVMFQWESFLRDSSKEELLNFVLKYDKMMMLYFEEVLEPIGIDYYQAPFMTNFFLHSMGIDLVGKYADGEQE